MAVCVEVVSLQMNRRSMGNQGKITQSMSVDVDTNSTNVSKCTQYTRTGSPRNFGGRINTATIEIWLHLPLGEVGFLKGQEMRLFP